MKSDIYSIEDIGINGINNPLFTLKFTTLLKDFKIEVLIDGKETKNYDLLQLGDNVTYAITLKCSKKVKRIRVNIINEKEKYELCNVNNNIFIRIFNKIGNIFKKIFCKIKILCHVLRKGIAFMWREYHFLVPPRMIKKYYRDFKKSMRSGDLRFYDPFNSIEYNKWLASHQTITEYEKMKLMEILQDKVNTYNRLNLKSHSIPQENNKKQTKMMTMTKTTKSITQVMAQM